MTVEQYRGRIIDLKARQKNIYEVQNKIQAITKKTQEITGVELVKAEENQKKAEEEFLVTLDQLRAVEDAQKEVSYEIESLINKKNAEIKKSHISF